MVREDVRHCSSKRLVKTATNKDLCLCSSPDSVSFVLQYSFLHPSVHLFLHHFQGQLPEAVMRGSEVDF